MNLSKRKAILFAACIIIALCSLFLLQPLPHPAPDVQRPVANAIDFLEGTNEPHALLWLDVIHRRFGIEEFVDSLQRYDQVITEQWQPLQLRVFRRIADHDNPLQKGDLEMVVDLDRVIVPALYCDRLGLPDDYAALLKEKVSFGGYELTHVLLACIWIQDNGCEVPLSGGFIENIYRANAALIGDDPVVEDLELEAAAFLYLAGQGKLVDDAFIERVIAAQNDDGGWSISGDSAEESDWHPTVLGLLLLLHVGFPSGSYPPILAPASP